MFKCYILMYVDVVRLYVVDPNSKVQTECIHIMYVCMLQVVGVVWIMSHANMCVSAVETTVKSLKRMSTIWIQQIFWFIQPGKMTAMSGLHQNKHHQFCHSFLSDSFILNRAVTLSIVTCSIVYYNIVQIGIVKCNIYRFNSRTILIHPSIHPSTF